MYNILIFPGWFPSKENPLNAIFTKKHINIISVLNNVTVVYAEKSTKQQKKYFIEIDHENGYPIYTCYYKPSSNYFIIYRKTVNFYRRIKAFLLALKSANRPLNTFDFIHIHVISFESIIPVFYKFFKKIPYFVSEHSTNYIRKTSKYSINNLFKKIIFSNSLGISVVSESLKNAIQKLNIHHYNFSVIQNYVDESKFEYKPKNNDVIKFLHVSRLDEKAKNVIGILNAFNQIIHKKSNKIELHIIGGALNVVSEAEIYSRNLESKGNIFFHGLKFGNEILEYYQEADILVMFSNYETQGVVVMEALFCGLPVLATNLPCLKEYLHDKNSLLVNPLSEKQLIEGMQLFLDKKWEIWDSEKIVIDIKNKFSSKTIGNSFLSLYKNGFIK
ncbi:hypothetical protein A5893_03730 [Pedobacter psychrophilus]|uniref:Glycosyl transferase family 1 domain-containing protein n=1 Tax=Pedobacter psychrophilus TaxID=1826909 RepID=A0A179DMT5_9SPHI|nr:glycosyltransferase family 4 protein [Pedobacter psychrophilus]OAQ42234.1 hypothetical protein A5893_03730 [Pedobacter psychrophilus]